MTTKARVAIKVLASFIAAAAISVAKLRYHCRIPDSEACVWAKAYYSATLPIETVVFGIAILLLVVFATALRARRTARRIQAP